MNAELTGMIILVRALAISTNPPINRRLVHIVPADHCENTSRELHGRVEGGEGVESLVEVQEMVLRQLEPSLHQVSYPAPMLRYGLGILLFIYTRFSPLDMVTPPRLPNPPLPTILRSRRPSSAPSPPKS